MDYGTFSKKDEDGKTKIKANSHSVYLGLRYIHFNLA